jgi:bifunctional non-homologous end joining protein LigD
LHADDGELRFVVQKHAARRLHYDLRLEVDGVMPSWAVPKGPSYDPAVRRLAVHVEDHPLDYRTFEGRIPRGAYGAGAVIVWDHGTYRNDSTLDGHPISVRAAIDKGHVSVWFEGDKLHGGWHLIRTPTSPSQVARPGADNWLLIKRRDEHADPARDVVVDAPESVQSGRTLEQVAAGEHEPSADAPVAANDRGAEVADGLPREDEAPVPSGDAAVFSAASWMSPMLAKAATIAEFPAVDDGAWLMERKFDGLRCVAVRNGSDVRLWSRNHQSYTDRFPAVVAALATLPATDFTIDGELVAFDTEDRTSFALLQQGDGSTQTVFCAFDLLHLLGRDTIELPTAARRALLAKVVTTSPALRLVEEVDGPPADALRLAGRLGWEGVVAKRRDAPYRTGRSPAWRKLKCVAAQELVIGGWTEPQGTREGFGALLVGVHDEAGLRYAGKVGTGFDGRTLREIAGALAQRGVPSSPFVDPVREPRVHWVTPDLVAQVSFTEWTAAGRLRHPSFLGLRDDVAADQVRRERVSG